MPEFNPALLRDKAKQRRYEKIDKDIDKIYPTIYRIENPEIIEGEPDYEKKIRAFKTRITSRYFCCLNYNYFLDNNITLNSLSYSLLWYISRIIDFNSNAVKFTREQSSKALNVNIKSIDNCIEDLCDNDIICKTDIRSMFIINHNVIFKGNIADFMILYKEVFGNSKPEVVDEFINDIDYVTGEEKARKGRILIKKYISNGKHKSTSI